MRMTTHWKVGELAARTGLSVRALHHYDEIGLLSPSARTAAGHRLYARLDVERLQQVQSLRSMGMSLDEVKRALDEAGVPPREIIRAQLAQIRERLASYGRLVERLESLAHHLDAADDEAVSIAELCRIIEGITSMEKYFSNEQLQTLRERAERIGGERIREAENEWAVIIPAVREAMERGDDPASAPVQALAARWKELVQAFTGGDPAISQAVMTMYREEGPALAPQLGAVPTAAMFEYIGKAWAAGRKRS